MPRPHTNSEDLFLRAYGAGAVLVILVGLFLANFSAGRALVRLSYDLPFLFQSDGTVPGIVLVLLDRDSMKQLGDPGQPLNREYHHQLLQRLIRDEARMVFYDILFLADHPSDAALAAAMREQGRVILGGAQEKLRMASSGNTGADLQRIYPPNTTLREAAAGWGLLMLEVDPGNVARRLFAGTQDYPSAVWEAASLSGAPVTTDPDRQHEPRWIHYYAASNAFDQVSLVRALKEDGVPPGFFKDKNVFIGAGRQSYDQFSTPYTRFHGHLTPGVEVLATCYANLMRSEWMNRMPSVLEWFLVIGWGLAAAALVFVRPWLALVLALVGACLLGVLAVVCHVSLGQWWPWLVPVLVQTPLGMVWGITWQYSRAARQRRRLRQAFGAYLSPHLADQIARSQMDLSLGGQEVEATVLFTDLEGFTRLCDGLAPRDVSAMLTTYFSRVTQQVLDREGTVIRYMGDALMAVWGAPLPDAEQARHAVEAAWAISQVEVSTRDGKPLRTRIGIHSGPGLAGNLGSDFRFDYSVIGETTNLASRLETLNKRLGTRVLAAETTRNQVGTGFSWRSLGSFQLSGSSRPTVVHELLGRVETGDDGPSKPWLERFQEGLDAYKTGNLAQAREAFQAVETLRGTPDSVSKFYLERIDSGAEDPGGMVVLSGK